MATVSSFEALVQPTRSDLRQFAELFRPLYENSSDDARRQAVAALSQCPTLPQAVCYFIGSQPIAIAAIFLSRSPAISDQTLIDVARSQGEPHARAIASREELSPAVVDALAALHDGAGYRARKQPEPQPQAGYEATISLPKDQPPVSEKRPTPLPERARLAREEALRDELRHLVSRNETGQLPPRILRGAEPIQVALLVRFARNRQTAMFSHTLADALGASQWLANRIMLDISGAQLAATLISLGLTVSDIRFILCRIYPHLAQAIDGRTRAHMLVRALDPEDCVARVAAWRRADHYTNTGAFEDTPDAANEDRTFERDGRYGSTAR